MIAQYQFPQSVYDVFQNAMPSDADFGWQVGQNYQTNQSVTDNLIASGIDLDAISQENYSQDFYDYMNANHVFLLNFFENARLEKSPDYNNTNTWVHTHNLNRKIPVLHIIDSNGNWINPEDVSSIVHTDSQVTITFTGPKTGFFWFM